ncbi:MAG TPA: hypothetical protein VGU72_04305 [Beijerinckiaceae bacterium]|jgi:hypothetical protein|nr:hypothetical protein [Beijerinckiaceae bacterium]
MIDLDMLSGMMDDVSGFGKRMGLSGSRISGGLGMAASTISAISAIAAGRAKAQAARVQAIDEWNQAEIVKVDTEQQQLGLKQQLLGQLAQRDSAYAASGVDIGSGVAADTRRSMTQSEVASGNVAQLAGSMRSRRHIINSFAAIQKSREEQAAGTLGAIGYAFKGISSLMGIG